MDRKTQYHGLQTAYHNTVKNDQKKKNSGALPPNPWIHIADNGFGAIAPKTDRGVPSGLPPCDPPLARSAQVHRAWG